MTTNPKSLAFDAVAKMLICELCVSWVRFDELYKDKSGVVWDVCVPCGERENA